MILVDSTDDSDFVMTKEDERDYWNGEGHLEFQVLSYDPKVSWEKYEIDWLDYSGCVGGLDEMLGISYAINEGILETDKLQFGYIYTLHEITAHWTRGDGWTTDDNVDYEVGYITRRFSLKNWISTWWWHLVGHHIRNWRNQ